MVTIQKNGGESHIHYALRGRAEYVQVLRALAAALSPQPISEDHRATISALLEDLLPNEHQVKNDDETNYRKPVEETTHRSIKSGH